MRDANCNTRDSLPSSCDWRIAQLASERAEWYVGLIGTMARRGLSY